ncbi:MAG: sulfopyruvate decarboxylase subunit beta [Frankiales bacterium]|jgi:thiamine pyrophosphate-dependent acetolactate synthase large subunit-like protein|nr:sulfopyruvate decarboxylase subunit beta [Frankiales bacterium]
MNRLDALRVIDRLFAEHLLIVTCGATARELAAISCRPNHLPLLDSMGLTSAVGLGVALSHPGPVGVIDGDGSILMGFSVLPTLACYAPANLTVIVLDNGQHASADGMPSQAAQVDIAGAADGLGLVTVRVDGPDELGSAVSTALTSHGFHLILAKIETGNTAGIPFRLDDPVVMADQFRLAADRLRRSGVAGAAGA